MRSIGRWAWVFVVLSVAACATRQETINRVQPNALDKKIFSDSDWYTLATVIDADYGAPLPVGDASSFSQIQFEIQEEFLIARRTHEYIRNQEGDGISSEGEPNRIVAMYQIESHFDIRREYNPVTGEEQNVVVENTRDRPWYEREFFRIDWSRNLVEAPDFSVTGGLSSIKLTPFSYFEQNDGQAQSFAPKFDRDEQGRISYFDLVNKYLAEPKAETLRLASGGTMDIPSCLLIFSSYFDCAPSEISVRQAFLRVEDRDYEPALYDSDRMDKFGYFLTKRDGYSRQYGLSRDERKLYLSRHNLWMQSHQRDTVGARVGCVSDAQCGEGGAYCDQAFGVAHELNEGVCALPFRDREVRPLVYFTSLNFPESLWPDAQALANDWDSAFRETVASLRAIECSKVGEAVRADCNAKYTSESVGRIFQLCHNPVSADDDEACGAEGKVVEIGDIRHNMLGYVPEPHSVAPLGFGPSYADPLTGELRYATAFVYGAALESASAYGRDVLALLRGDLATGDVQDNRRLQSWRDSLRSTTTSAGHPGSQHVIDLDGRDVREANADMNFDWILDRARDHMPPLEAPKNAAEMLEAIDLAGRAVGRASETLALERKAAARRQKLVETDIETLLINDEVKLRAGVLPTDPASTVDLDKYSPMRGQSLTALRSIDMLRRQLRLSRSHCVAEADFVDNGLLSLVRRIDRALESGTGVVTWYGVDYPVGQDGVIDYDQVEQMLRHPLFQAVTAHEVGHTLGLRHNFSGSWDAMNYSPRYWELRDDGNMKPRVWNDPMTDAEIEGGIREYEYSTVMDYGHNFIVTDSHGIGHYDRAAIKMGYGDMVEVFTQVPSANVMAVGALADRAGGGLFGRMDFRTNGFRFLPYTEFPALIGGIEAMEAREDVRYSDLQLSSNVFTGLSAKLDPEGRPPVPYVYCGDEYADFQMHCMRYDAGADSYETMQSVIDSYWNYYPFSHFQRQSLTWDVNSAINRTYGRYLSKLEDGNRIYSRYRAIFGTILEATGGDPDAFAEAEDGLGAYTVGVRAAYDLLRRIITTPEPGAYNLAEDDLGRSAYVEGSWFSQGGDLVLDDFEGRALRTGFDFGPDFTMLFFDRAGYYYDKALALMTMVHSSTRFIGEDTQADLREFASSFYTTFPDSVSELFRAMIAHDRPSFSPRVVDNQVVFPTPQEIADHGMATSGIPLAPNFAFSLEAVAMVEGMVQIPRSFDQAFIQSARIWVRDGLGAVNVPDTVEFFDEKSGLTYVAPSYKQMKGADLVETGVGASMLLRAQALSDADNATALDDWMDNVNLMRNIGHHFGFPIDNRVN